MDLMTIPTFPVFDNKQPVIINTHGVSQGKYGIISTKKSTCNSEEINHIISVIKRNKHRNPNKVPSMVHIKLDRTDMYVTV